MTIKTYRIVGLDDHWGEEVMLNVYEEVEKGSLSVALTYETPIRPSLAARKGHRDDISGELLVTETGAHGTRFYGAFRRAFDGTWYFSWGVVASMRDGWHAQGSISRHGKIVHDSGGFLDRLLETTTQRDDLYPGDEIFSRTHQH